MNTERSRLRRWQRAVLALVLVGILSTAWAAPGAAQVVAPPVAPPAPPVVSPPQVAPLPPSVGTGTDTPLWCYVWSGPWCPEGDLNLEDLPSWPGNPFGSQLIPGDTSDAAVMAESGWLLQYPAGLTVMPAQALPAGVGEAGSTMVMAYRIPAEHPEDEWLPFMSLVGSSGGILDWRVRREITGIQHDGGRCHVQIRFNGSALLTQSTSSIGFASDGSLGCAPRANFYTSGSAFVVGADVRADNGRGGSSQSSYWDDGWQSGDSWRTQFRSLPALPVFAGVVDAVGYALVPRTGFWRFPGGSGAWGAAEAVIALLSSLWISDAPPTEVPYDPDLPEIDPNEVPEIAPAVPVPWPDGWPIPEVDDPPPSPSTSTVPDPTPRPTLVESPPGDVTDTTLATRIMDGFGWLGDRIGGFFDWLVSELWRMVQWIIDRIREMLFELIRALTIIARWIVTELGKWFEWLAGELVKALARIAQILLDGLGSLIQWARSIYEAMLQGFGSLVSTIGSWAEWIGIAIQSLGTFLQTVLSGLLSTLMEFLNGLAVWMVNAIGTITVNVALALDLVVDVFLDLAVELFVPTWTWTEVLPDPPPPPPEPLPPGIPESWGAQCGPSFAIPVVNLTLRTPNPPDSGCPGHGPGGARTTADDLQGSVWGYRNALRALLAFSLWLSVGFVGLRAMPWSRSRDDASDTFVAAGGGL